MILISDSGSTKTDWVLSDGGTVMRRVRTEGINPFHQSVERIDGIIHENLLPSIGDVDIEKVFFYGSGCTPEMVPVVSGVLSNVFPDAGLIDVNGDLMAAARAVCGRRKGVACILGTGANSCLYDGTQIIANTPPLGYILGDEGSGAVLGKLFLNALLKGFLPSEMKNDFFREYGVTYPDIIRKVYREPQANRFLATTANFISAHTDNAQLRKMVCDNFHDFFRRNLSQYNYRGPVGFVGGIAYQFSHLLETVADEEGYSVSVIMKSPIDGLLKYHIA